MGFRGDKRKQPLMRFRSKKRESEYQIRRPLVVKMLEKYPHCQACGVFAKHDGKVTYQQNPSQDIHELVRGYQNTTGVSSS
jgi:hypothetical protein